MRMEQGAWRIEQGYNLVPELHFGDVLQAFTGSAFNVQGYLPACASHADRS